MGCACGGGVAGRDGLEVLGYRVTLPDGTKVPPEDQAPFLTKTDAQIEQRQAGGGTIVRLVRRRAAEL